MRRLLWLILVLILFGYARAGVIDSYRRQTSGVFGLKAGVVSGGEIKISRTYETVAGLTGQAFFDLPLCTGLFAVGALDFYDLRIAHHAKWLLDANVGLKPSFHIRRFEADIKPAVSIGWGHLEMESSYETCDFLMLRLSCESHFYVSKKTAWVLEAAILSTPTGGNHRYPNATIGPLFLIRAGVALR